MPDDKFLATIDELLEETKREVQYVSDQEAEPVEEEAAEEEPVVEEPVEEAPAETE